MTETAALLAELVSVESINPVLVPGGAGEGRIARRVAEWLEAAGLETLLEEAAPGRPNAVAVARGTGGGRSLLLVAHTERSASRAWNGRSSRAWRTVASTGAAPTT